VCASKVILRWSTFPRHAGLTVSGQSSRWAKERAELAEIVVTQAEARRARSTSRTRLPVCCAVFAREFWSILMLSTSAEYKTGKASLFAQGKRRYDRKQASLGTRYASKMEDSRR
jgi:hypothetical protein